jgi:hypothetical protein
VGRAVGGVEPRSEPGGDPPCRSPVHVDVRPRSMAGPCGAPSLPRGAGTAARHRELGAVLDRGAAPSDRGWLPRALSWTTHGGLPPESATAGTARGCGRPRGPHPRARAGGRRRLAPCHAFRSVRPPARHPGREAAMPRGSDP